MAKLRYFLPGALPKREGGDKRESRQLHWWDSCAVNVVAPRGCMLIICLRVLTVGNRFGRCGCSKGKRFSILQQDCIFFHLPKAGGTSIMDFFRTQIHEIEVIPYASKGPPRPPSWATFVKEQMKSPRRRLNALIELHKNHPAWFRRGKTLKNSQAFTRARIVHFT